MDSIRYSILKSAELSEVRRAIRGASYQGQTAGLAAGKLQANLVIIPRPYALDFMRFCQRNPKPCPLVGVTDTGDPILRTLGMDLDIRTDVPAYNVYENGSLKKVQTNISDVWSENLVGFAIGCSFTFEQALINANIRIWHIENNKTVPMYRSSIRTCRAGPFGGEMVVTMRGVAADKVSEAIRISRRFPLAHGGPVHIGEPSKIGIDDLYHPDWGDSPPDLGDDVPMFWACGVTPQNALMQSKLPLFITHKPGHMLITDITEHAEVPIIDSPGVVDIAWNK